MRIVGVLGVLALVATVATMAATRDDLSRPNFPGKQEGEMYDRNDIFPPPGDGVQTPRPIGEENDADSGYLAKPGPIAIGKQALSLGGGSALVSPRGGLITTPKMQADREIQRLIRKLD